jgi:nitrogenase-associated protein
VTEIVFFEKPGCIGNARQKKLLANLGHRLRVKDLLRTPWNAEELRSYFGQLPVPEWFNPSAPKVRDGEIELSTLDEAAALQLLLSDPLLIRRPLIDAPQGRCAGFLHGPVLAALGVPADAATLDSCARGTAESACDAKAAACRTDTAPRERGTHGEWTGIDTATARTTPCHEVEGG